MSRRTVAVTKLPKQFKLLNHTVKIVVKKGLMEEHTCYGMWDATQLVIYIDPDVPQSVLAHTLWHEMMHAILDLTGHTKLSKNERFVDSMGGALAQVVATIR